MATKLSEHFTIEELTYSATAADNKIDNTPTKEHIDNLTELVTNLLEPLRVAWGKPINVTSCYRGFRLNQKVRGAKASAHCVGYAADIVPSNRDIAGFKKFVREWLHNTNTAYDQYIDEAKKNGSEWVHVGIRNSKGKQRKQDLITTDGVNYRLLPRWTKKG